VLNRIYLVLGSAILIFYGLTALNGWEFGQEEREVVPASERSSPGWARSTVFWHAGYRGGK
jgi:hypothetical protein